MKTLHGNPFKFGHPVEGDYFLPHPHLSSSVKQFLENHIHVVLIGPRRIGKTSFVLNLLKEMQKDSYTTLFVDIFNITSHRDFLQQLLRPLKHYRKWKSHLKKAVESLTELRPKISQDYDHVTGQSSLGFSLDKTSDKDVKNLIQDVLAELDTLGEKIIVAIDEFQKITEIQDGGWLEATLRSHMQRMKNSSFLFTGSRRGMIYDMLNNPSRPLYRSCQPIEFPIFGNEFTDWILERFSRVQVKCEWDAIDDLRKRVQEMPNYVQMVCFHLATQAIEHIGAPEIDQTLNAVALQNGYAYQTLLNSLSLPQQRALRLIAIEKKEIFSKHLLERYEMASSPTLASSIKALKTKGIIDAEVSKRGEVVFDDPLFAIWLRKTAIKYG